MRAIIVDDEKQPREAIKNILSIKNSGVEIIAEAENVKSAIEIIKTKLPEIVFLDIELQDGTGFDILKSFDNISFKVIFVTGYKDFAIEAFKFSALDYILKPVNSEELLNAIKKAEEQIELQNQSFKFDALFSNFQNIAKENKKIVLKTQESIHLVNLHNIIRCQSDNTYITFFLNDGKKILVTNSMKEYEEMLSPYGFYRVHQSHLINLNCISKFEKKDGGYIVLNDNSNIPVSQRKRQQFLEVFERLHI